MIKKTTIFLFLSIVATAVLGACNSPEETTPEPAEPASEGAEEVEISKLFVGPERVECEGEGPQQCYLVKENPEDEWELFYNQIEGFNYEEGFDYEIEVEVTPVENPPAGGSSLQYTWLRTLNKQPNPEYQAESEIVVLFVGPEKVACEGAGPQECYLVKENPEDEWELFYNQIEGFNYEEGFDYEIEVEVTPVENPPADGSSLQYTWIRTLNKQPNPDYQAESEIVRMFVGPEKVTCEGAGPQECYLVKENPEDEWELFYNQIEGFNYEPGFDYEIEVEVTPVENPPADGSSLQYTWIRTLNKQQNPDYQPEAEEVVWIVGPELVDCVGVGPQKCMLIKENPEDDWQYFYSSIDGFDYEEGNVYVIRVLVEPVANPPADGSSLKYTLIEVIEQQPVEVTNMSSAATFENTLWSLAALTYPDGTVNDLVPETKITIQFAGGEFNGNGGCNGYFGSYELDGEMITLGPIGSTQKLCLPEEINTQESAYFAQLGTVTQIALSENILLMLNADGNAIFVFEATEPATLTNTLWEVMFYNNGTGGAVSVLGGSRITAQFNEDGSLNGNSGCNNYGTSYEVDGENISINEMMAATLMMCSFPEGVMEQEQAYLAALPTAATYTIVDDVLELRTTDGALVASYKATKPIALPGSAWDVVNYNNGNQAVVSVIIGSSITAVFQEDGMLVGNAGCNNYSASYEYDGDTINIGPAATTRMACSEPEGIMEQEAQYLAALETAATYKIDAERMEMRTADGAKVAGFVIQGYVPPEVQFALDNATYSSEFTESGEVTLVNGEFSQPVAEGSATQLRIQNTEYTAMGVDGENNNIIATVLVSDPGGSGTFYSLHVMQFVDGQLVEVAATSLGDRVQINSVKIANGNIVVDMVQSGADDPLCCPTEHVLNTYTIQDGELDLIDSQVIEDEE